MKTERRGKTPYTENIVNHVPSPWCVHKTFVFGNAIDILKLYCDKDCVKHIEYEFTKLYAAIPQQPMTELIDISKRENEAAENICNICYLSYLFDRV